MLSPLACILACSNPYQRARWCYTPVQDLLYATFSQSRYSEKYRLFQIEKEALTAWSIVNFFLTCLKNMLVHGKFRMIFLGHLWTYSCFPQANPTSLQLQPAHGCFHDIEAFKAVTPVAAFKLLFPV